MNERREYSYSYHRLGEAHLIRVVHFRSSGLKCGAESFNPVSGAFELANTLMSRLDTSPDAEELTREAFYEQCRAQRRQ